MAEFAQLFISSADWNSGVAVTSSSRWWRAGGGFIRVLSQKKAQSSRPTCSVFPLPVRSSGHSAAWKQRWPRLTAAPPAGNHAGLQLNDCSTGPVFTHTAL